MPEIDIVGEVGDTDAAVASVRAISPHLLLLDLSMPGAGGLTAIRRIRQVDRHTPIVVLTRHRDLSFVQDALAAGATGYVLKQSPFSEVQRAVHHAVRGERYIDGQLRASIDNPPDGPRGRRVSARERDVLRRAALGQGNKEIAASLGIAVKTVEVHKAEGMRKLDLHDRAELVRYATLQGWLADL
jgi:DNA-binding NarL/FixJ family response regulator